MFGIRDAVLGGLLYSADSPAAVHRALIAGMVVDGIDTLIATFGVWNGDLEMLAGDFIGGERWCLWGWQRGLCGSRG
jgi:hypothetical protein